MSFLRSSQSPSYPYKIIDTLAGLVLGIGTLVLPLFTLPFTRDQIDFPKELFLYGMVGIGALLWVLRGSLARELVIRRSIIDTPLIVLLLGFLISTLFSVSPTLSWVGRPNSFILHFSVFFAFGLWTWLLLQYVRSATTWRIFVQLFLAGGTLTALLFVFHAAGQFFTKLDWFGLNAIHDMNSMFGIYLAVVGTLALGILMDRSQQGVSAVIPWCAAVSCFVALARLGFSISWAVSAVGLGLLVLLGATQLAVVRRSILLCTFFLWLLSVIFSLNGTPDVFKEKLPAEIALGARSSWDISLGAVVSSAKTFILGYGPGTFVRLFSQFRPAGFNNVDGLAATRFIRPYNTLLAVFAEGGILAILIFIFLTLFQVGNIVSAWIKRGPEVVAEQLEYEDTSGAAVTIELHPLRRFEGLVVGIAWLAATVGLGLGFYTIALWCMWWWLLAIGMVGLASHTRLLKEQTVLLDLMPQYSLVFSFALIVLATSIGFFVIFMGKVYLAERAYTLAARSANLSDQERHILEALAYRPAYSEYRLALASVYFIQAKAKADSAHPQPDQIANDLSNAVAQARAGELADPNNVETWETLSLLYLNARGFAAEANGWARTALNRALELEPTNAVLVWRLGNTEEFDANWAAAEKLYRQAIDLRPNYVPAYVSLAQTYEHGQKLDQAVSVFVPILPLVERDPELLFFIGRLLYNRNQAGDSEQAEAIWRRAVALAPNYSNALYSLGLLYERRGQAGKALEYYQRVAALNPNNSDIKKKLVPTK